MRLCVFIRGRPPNQHLRLISGDAADLLFYYFSDNSLVSAMFTISKRWLLKHETKPTGWFSFSAGRVFQPKLDAFFFFFSCVANCSWSSVYIYIHIHRPAVSVQGHLFTTVKTSEVDHRAQRSTTASKQVNKLTKTWRKMSETRLSAVWAAEDLFQRLGIRSSRRQGQHPGVRREHL